MWKKVEFQKAQINYAGKHINDIDLNEEQRLECLQIIDNWRAAHAFPMNTFAIQLKHLTQNIKNAIVVQRLKRLDTIVDKLKRFPSMELYRMQDLGGCRVIVPNIENVYQVVDRLRNSRIRHVEHNYKDYIAIPNPNTGYRGYHLIYRYKSDKRDDYNGLQIEIQIRTVFQHLWATAVEMVGMFTDNGLKFNQGSEDWLHFFKLVSGLFAIEEQAAVPEGVPTNIEQLMTELRNIMIKLDAANKLLTIGLATRVVGHIKKTKKPGYYLLIMNLNERSLTVNTYPGIKNGLDKATEDYNRIEKEKENKKIDAVLVSAQSYESIVSAYPNYFANISSFTKLLSTLLGKYMRKNQ